MSVKTDDEIILWARIMEGYVVREFIDWMIQNFGEE